MICFTLYSTANAMVREYSGSLKELGTTYPQLLIMAALWEKNNISISELSEKTLFDQGSLTPILKRMIVGGFVVILPEPLDKRKKIVKLTKSGFAFRHNAEKIFNSMRCKISLTGQDQKSILLACRKIRDGLSFDE